MFARHLLLQGYKPDQVTILTTYSGQMFQFRSVRSYIVFFLIDLFYLIHFLNIFEIISCYDCKYKF